MFGDRKIENGSMALAFEEYAVFIALNGILAHVDLDGGYPLCDWHCPLQDMRHSRSELCTMDKASWICSSLMYVPTFVAIRILMD